MGRYTAKFTSSLYRPVFDTVLSRTDPEQAHEYVTRGLEAIQRSDTALSVLGDGFTYEDERLKQDFFGLHFENPVGIAAGFDKNARVVPALEALGFGYIEVGGVTSHPQDGNPGKRLFRIPEENAIINRMGFNNDGVEKVADRLSGYDVDVPLGINLGESHELLYAETATETMNELQEYGDYFVANVSCPNMEGEDLQSETQIGRILSTLQDENFENTPLLIKVAPDLKTDELDVILDVALDYDIDGIIATNTSTRRDVLDGEAEDYPDGGLSGNPIKDLSTETISDTYNLVGDDVPIIGVGGVSTAEDAYEKTCAGASLVQLYTGFIYEGPTIAYDINAGLVELLEEDGYDHITEAVGTDHP